VYLLQGALADQLLQVWEFACCFGPLLGLEQVPSPQQLERGLLGVISHTGTAASSILTAPPDGDHHPHRDAPDNTAAAAGVAAGDAGAAAVDVSPEQVEFDAAAGAAWVQLHVAVLSVLVQVSREWGEANINHSIVAATNSAVRTASKYLTAGRLDFSGPRAAWRMAAAWRHTAASMRYSPRRPVLALLWHLSPCLPLSFSHGFSRPLSHSLLCPSLSVRHRPLSSSLCPRMCSLLSAMQCLTRRACVLLL
jgi:hypothetical protein